MNAAAVWLREIRGRVAGGLDLDWRYFSLEQVNQRAGEGVDVWDWPAGFESASLHAFAASEATRRVGDSAQWEHLHYALLAARHSGQKEALTRGVVERIAGEVGLDVVRLRREMDSPTILEPLAQQHQEALAEGVFGTPTLVFEDGSKAFLKMLPAPTGEEALQAWERIEAIVAGSPYIAEIKRPRKPGSR